MKKTFACPHCKHQQTCDGTPGKRHILTCTNCGTKGIVTFPTIPAASQPPHKLSKIPSKKQLITLSIALIFILSTAFILIIPTVQGTMHFLTVQSGSMKPDMQVGDVVVSSWINPQDIKIGDIITFKYGDSEDPHRYITHRVIEIIPTEGDLEFKTKGDANEDPDPRLVTTDDLIGKVILVVPYLGHFGNFARSTYGYILFLLIPAILIIVYESRRIIKIRNEETLKKS
jgi:signal peptidase